MLPEDDIQALIRQFLEQTHPKEDSIFTYSAPQYYKTYLLTKNPESYYPAESENALEIYVCYDEYMNGVYHWTVYTPLVFRNLILHPDGTVDGLDYESGSDAVFYTEPEQIIKAARADKGLHGGTQTSAPQGQGVHTIHAPHRAGET